MTAGRGVIGAHPKASADRGHINPHPLGRLDVGDAHGGDGAVAAGDADIASALQVDLQPPSGIDLDRLPNFLSRECQGHQQ